MKTLTPKGINKQLLRLRDSLDYATYIENGTLKKVAIFRADVTDNKINIFLRHHGRKCNRSRSKIAQATGDSLFLPFGRVTVSAKENALMFGEGRTDQIMQ